MRLQPLARRTVVRLDRLLALIVAMGLLALLFGCSSFNLGAMAYCPHGQACTLRVVPPEVAASGTPL